MLHRLPSLFKYLTKTLPLVWWHMWLTLWSEIDSDHNIKYRHVAADDGYAGDLPMRDFSGDMADSGGGE